MDSDKIPILMPYEPADFWQRMKELVRTELIALLKNMDSAPSVYINGLVEKPLYKINEVCKMFQVTRPTIYEWIKAGKLKRVKIRSRVYFLGDDIHGLMQPDQFP